MSVRKSSSISVDWDDVARRNYASSLRSFRGWFDAADELQFAAELIRPQVAAWWEGLLEWQRSSGKPRSLPSHGCHSILMMLNGFVIENLCKGTFVRDGLIEMPSFLETPSQLPKAFKSHNLTALVSKLDLHLEDHEEDLLGRMRRAAVWRGRYPVAIKYNAELHTLQLSDGRKVNAATFMQSDVPRMEAFISRLRTHLGAERNAGVARDAAP